MNRLVIAVGTATAACAAAVPAVLGLSGNPSFSQHIPVPVPSHAQLVHFDDRGRIADDRLSPSASSSQSTSSDEPGDDHGGLRTSREPEPGDDHGGLRPSSEPEPGDDHGGLRTSSEPEPGDDHGGDRGRGGGDDGGQTSFSGDDHSGHGGGDDD